MSYNSYEFDIKFSYWSSIARATSSTTRTKALKIHAHHIRYTIWNLKEDWIPNVDVCQVVEEVGYEEKEAEKI
jgi:hypothetical protein